MNPIVQILTIALLAGAAQAGGRRSRYNHGVELHHSSPVYSKSYSTPLLYARSAPSAVYAAAPVQYAQAVQYAAPVQYAAAPQVAYAAPAAHYHQAPAHYHQAPAHYHQAPALTYAQPAIPSAPVALLSTAGKPQVYGKSINAAAIRNIETVMVTKTITPVVTKTTTHHTSAEPALSVGHVQGYSQSAAGQAKLAPVQFNTQYTSYANPTVGVNGPVVYSGLGVAQVGVAAAAPAAVGVAVPEPVALKTAVAAAPVYKEAVVAQAPAYYRTIATGPSVHSVYPGATLSLENYGLEAHSVPVSNFLELRSGQAVLSGYQKK